MPQIGSWNKVKEKSPENKFWNLSTWSKLDQTMVREIDATWNPTYDSILLMYQKLMNLKIEER